MNAAAEPIELGTKVRNIKTGTVLLLPQIP